MRVHPMHVEETKDRTGFRWRLRFGASLEVERDGEPFRFRTRQQLLLLARLVADAREPLDRAGAARLLWPEAEASHARTYLRRAVMEMRAAGVALRSSDEGLTLDETTIESDFEDAAASGSLGAAGERLAPGWESPMLDEIRALVRRRARRTSGAPASSNAEEDADRAVLSLLGAAVLAYSPGTAMALVAAHRYDFYTKAPEPDLLRFLNRLCDLVREPSADRIAVLCVTAGISSVETLYTAADALYREAIAEAETLGEAALLARALAMRCGTLVELRDWPRAKDAAERAVTIARETGDPTAIAFSLAARAAYEWHIGLYDEAVESYRAAIDLAEPGAHRDIARHNQAFVWGVLGGRLEPPPQMPTQTHYDGVHLPGGQAYELFSLGIGHGRYREAARGAAGALSFAADGGMERLVAINLDNAGIAFAKLGLMGEAAACVRLGTRLRRLLDHVRSPMEHDALRRHLDGDYFAPGVDEWRERWRSDEPVVTAYRVAARLRLVAED